MLPNSKGNRLSGGVKNTMIKMICDFRLKSPFISKIVRDGTVVTSEHEQEVKAADRSVSVPMTYSDLERLNARGQIFQMDLLHYVCTV